MTLGEFRKLTAFLSDDTTMFGYDGEYGDPFELSDVVIGGQKEKSELWHYLGHYHGLEDFERFKRETEGKIAII